jgi:cystathionine beta-synthase
VGLVVDYEAIDKGVQVTDSQAFETARYLARHTGLLVGGSTGGAVYKALEFIHGGLIRGNVLSVVADGGEKYLHTVFNEQWLRDRQLLDPQVSANLRRWLD